MSKFKGGQKDEGVRFIFIKFQNFKVMYPPFSRVLMLVVCLLSPKSIRFAKYRGFKVICVSQPNFIFYFGILRCPTLHFQVFWLWWCVYISLIVHHLEDMEGLTFKWMVDFFILTNFESLETTYPLIFKGCDDNGFFILNYKFKV